MQNLSTGGAFAGSPGRLFIVRVDYLYAPKLLAFPHQISQLEDFVTTKAPRSTRVVLKSLQCRTGICNFLETRQGQVARNYVRSTRINTEEK